MRPMPTYPWASDNARERREGRHWVVRTGPRALRRIHDRSDAVPLHTVNSAAESMGREPRVRALLTNDGTSGARHHVHRGRPCRSEAGSHRVRHPLTTTLRFSRYAVTRRPALPNGAGPPPRRGAAATHPDACARAHRPRAHHGRATRRIPAEPPLPASGARVRVDFQKVAGDATGPGVGCPNDLVAWLGAGRHPRRPGPLTCLGPHLVATLHAPTPRRPSKSSRHAARGRVAQCRVSCAARYDASFSDTPQPK
jgi:hypothetical protein